MHRFPAKRQKPISKSKAVTIGFKVAVLMLGGAGLAAYFNMRQLSNAQQWVNHTHKVIETVHLAIEQTHAFEQAVQSYLITDNESYLAAHQLSRMQVQQTLRSLQALTTDNPDQQQRLQRLEQQVNQKSELHEQAIRLSQNNSANSPWQVLWVEQENALHRQIHHQLQEMIVAEERLLEERSQITNVRAGYMTIAVGASYTISLILLAFIYRLLKQEISQRQEAEAALRQKNEYLQQSETLFRSLCESSPVGIFMADAQGYYTYINRECQQICGYELTEALGDGWLRFVHPNDQQQVHNEWRQVIEQAETHLFKEMRYLHADGEVRYGRVQTAPILIHSGLLLGYVGTIEDITESRAIAQMKNEFISVVSHELRTPLTAIRGSLGLLANGIYDNKPEKGKKMLQLAADQTERLVRLVNDILDLGRLESGKVSLVMQSCEAKLLMMQSADAVRSIAEQHQITISVEPFTAQVWASPDSIIQTLTNLLSNAIKFSPPRSTIWLSAKLTSTAGKYRGDRDESDFCTHVLFIVKDQGCGIPTDKIETIFRQFQQVDAADSRRKGGTGLGLSICRNIVEQHGGYIWAESVVGVGSSFYFTLPLAPDPIQQDPIKTDDPEF